MKKDAGQRRLDAFGRTVLAALFAVTLISSNALTGTAYAAREDESLTTTAEADVQVVDDALPEGDSEVDEVGDAPEADEALETQEGGDASSIVNYATRFQVIPDTKTVETGAAHILKVRASYSNPNDIQDVTLRLYFWNYDSSFETDKENFVRTPMTDVELLDFVDGRALFELDGNEDLYVALEEKTETDDAGNVTAHYVEFVLSAGSKVSADLSMLVPSGNFSDKSIIAEPVIYETTDTDNQVCDDPQVLTWTGEFSWTELKKLENSEEAATDPLQITVGTKDKPLAPVTDLSYSFTATPLIKGTGVVWTKSITVDDELIIPASLLSGVDSWTIDAEKGCIYADDSKEVTLFSIGTMNDETYTYTVNILELVKNSDGTATVKANFTVDNPKVDESGMLTADLAAEVPRITFNISKIDLPQNYRTTDEDVITNKAELTFTPAAASGLDPIKLNDDVEALLAKDTGKLSITKRFVTNNTIRYFGYDGAETTPVKETSFNISASNADRFAVTRTLFDVLPQNVFLKEDSVTKLTEDGFTVKHVDVIYQQGQSETNSSSYLATTALENGAVTVETGSVKATSAPTRVLFELTRNEVDSSITLTGTAKGKVTLTGEDADGNAATVEAEFENLDLAQYRSQVADVAITGGEALATITSVTIEVDTTGITDQNGNSSSLTLVERDLRILGPQEAPTSLTNTYTVESGNSYEGEYQFSANNYWQVGVDKSFNVMKSHTAALNPRVSFDLTLSSPNSNQNVIADNLIFYVAVMINDGWEWKDAKVGPVTVSKETSGSSSDAEDSASTMYATSSTLHTGCYTVPVSVYFDGDVADAVQNASAIQYVGVQIIGSGSRYSGQIYLDNIRYEDDSTKAANYFEKEITIDPLSSYSTNGSYTVVTPYRENLCTYNTAFLGKDGSCLSSDAELIIKPTYIDELNRSSVVSITKEISTRYSATAHRAYTPDYSVYTNTYEGAGNPIDPLKQANLTTLGKNDILFYTVTLKNDGTEDKDITVIDANPLYGHYNYYRGDETMTDSDPGWTARFNQYSAGGNTWNNTVPIRMWKYSGQGGYTSAMYGTPYAEFVDNLRGEYVANGKYSQYTVCVPAGKTLRQTFVLDMREVTDFDLFEAAVRQVMTAGNTTYNPSGWSSYTSNKAYDRSETTIGTGTYASRQLDPTNTVFIKGKGNQKNGGLGATVLHCLPTRYGIRQFVAGSGVYPLLVNANNSWYSESEANVYNQTYYGVFANYDTEDTLNVLNQKDEYVVYGVTLLNDSSEGLPADNTYVNLKLPSGLEFVDLLRPSYEDAKAYDGTLLPAKNELGQPRLYRTKYSSNAGSYYGDHWDIINPYDLGTIKGSNRWFTDGTWTKYTDFETTVGTSASTGDTGTIKVTLNNARMPAYTSFTFYYLCRVLPEKTGGTIDTTAEWVFSDEASSYKPGWSSNDDGAKNFHTEFQVSTDLNIYMAKTNKAGSAFNYPVGSMSSRSGAMSVSSTTRQNIDRTYTRVGLAKAVVGRNSYGQITQSNTGGAYTDTSYASALLNNFRYNMNYYSAKDTENSEVVTFMIAVGNNDDIKESGSNNTYTVEDTLPSNFSFLGVHQVLHNLYVATSADGVPEHYLGKLITSSSSPISGHLYQPGERSYNESTQTSTWGDSSVGDGFVSVDMSSVAGNTTPIPSAGSYTFSRSGNKLTFTVTQPKGTVSYIFYSCRVYGNSGKVTNTAKITSGSSNMINWPEMVTSDYTNSYLHIGNNGRTWKTAFQNIALGTQPSGKGSPIEATVDLEPLAAYGSYELDKAVDASYDNADYTKNLNKSFWPSSPDFSAQGPDVYYENGNTEGKAYDGTPLWGLLQTQSPDGQMGNVLDVGASGLDYSIIDGIHPISWYRKDAVWHVSVKNTSDNSEGLGLTLDAGDLVETIDQPFKIYGYALTLRSNTNTYIGTYYVDYRGTEDGFMPVSNTKEAGYTSKVTGEETIRNEYRIDLAKDAQAAYRAVGRQSGTTTTASGITYSYTTGNSYDAIGQSYAGTVDSGYTGNYMDLGFLLDALPCGWYYDVYIYSDLTEDNLDWYYNTVMLPTTGEQEHDWVTSIGTDGIYHYNREVTDSGKNDPYTSKGNFIGVGYSASGLSLMSDRVLADLMTLDSSMGTEAAASAYATTGEEVKFTMEMVSNLYQTQRYTDGTLENITMYALLPGTSGGYIANEPGGGFVVNTDSFSAYILRSDGTKESVDPSAYDISYSFDALHGGRHPLEVNDTIYHVDFTRANIEDLWLPLDKFESQGGEDAECEIGDIRSVRVKFNSSIVLSEGDRLFVDYSGTMREDAIDGIKYRTIFGYIYNLKAMVDGEEYNKRLYEDTVDDTTIASQGYIALKKVDEDGNTVNFAADGSTTISYEVFRDAAGRYPVYFKKPTSDTPSSFNFLDSTNVKEDGSNAITTIVSHSGTTYLRGLPYGTYYIYEVEAPAGYQLNEGPITVTVNSSGSFKAEYPDPNDGTPTTLTIVKTDLNDNVITSANAKFVMPIKSDGSPSSVKTDTLQAFIDLGTDSEKGHRYKFATSADDPNAVTELETYMGRITIEEVPYPGYSTYYLFETQTPDGYSITSDCTYYSTGSTGTSKIMARGWIEWRRYQTVRNAVLTVTNAPGGSEVVIEKRSGLGALLEGVTYQLYAEEEGGDPLAFKKDADVKYGNYTIPHYTYVADPSEDDEVTYDLSTEGSYLIIAGLDMESTYYGEETSAPADYIAAAGRFQVPADATDTYGNKLVTVVNTPTLGAIQVLKRDSQDNILADDGFKFQLIDEEGNLVSAVLQETDYPSYLVADDTTEGEKVSEFATVNGTFFIVGLKAGTYTLKETATIDGFTLADPVEITVDYANNADPVLPPNVTYELTGLSDVYAINTFDVVNEHDTGDVNIAKVENKYTSEGEIDGTAAILEAAEFTLLKGDATTSEDAEAVTFTLSEGVYVYDEGGSATITTIDGMLPLRKLPLGTYTLRETAAPEGYELADDLVFEVTDEHYFKPLQLTVVEEHSTGSAIIEKYNANGDLIDCDDAVFYVTDEDNHPIAFVRGDVTDSGREYTYTTETGVKRLTMAGGRLSLKDLPLGTYLLREVVAPEGYSRYEGTITFTVTDANYSTPLVVKVTDPEYVYGGDLYTSASWKKIEEIDKSDNIAYGYYGHLGESVPGNKNYIVVDDAADLVRYTISVGNMSEKNFEKLVLIDKLPAQGDTGVVNLEEQRESEFTVKLAAEPNFEVKVVDNYDNELPISEDDYRIELGSETSFTEADFDGEYSYAWNAGIEDAVSFRLTFSDDFVLPAGYRMFLTFEGQIQDDADPGEIAWNDFGYRYYVGSKETTNGELSPDGLKPQSLDGEPNMFAVTPEPPKVGVKIPINPKLTKVMEGVEDGLYTFTFDVYEVDEEGNLGSEPVATLTAKNGETVELLPHRIINGVDNGGYLEANKTYRVVERGVGGIANVNVDGTNGKPGTASFEFVMDSEKETTAVFTNEIEKISIPVTKSWVDGDDADDLRPDSVTVHLLANGEDTGESLVLSDENSWKGTFADLPLWVDGTAMEYSVSEDIVEAYETSISGDVEQGFTITNTHVPAPEVTEISVAKVWDDSDNAGGLRPGSVTVHLLADGADTGLSLVLSDENSWKGTFTDLPVLGDDGEKIAYSVEEEAVENYVTTITGTAADGFTVTNSSTPGPELTEIPVVKVWKDSNNALGKRPNSVTVHLLAGGADTGQSLVLSDANGWKGTFANLPVLNDEGKKISYSVAEEAVAGYKGKITGSAKKGFIVTNTSVKPIVPRTDDPMAAVPYVAIVLAAVACILAAVVLRKRSTLKR